ncbi:tetratricopeptide repeat protein [Melioribacteraceae bacterium 4301-Me]|uniref:tetratricopeptide repeat protein n=1 Tax=Pyranulibacter aquaticus TaxID=3163344 RepID=UPI003597CF34
MKKISIILFFILSVSLLFAQSKSEEAYKAIQNSNFEKALTLAKDLLTVDSTDTALKVLIILREKEPGNIKVQEMIGDVYNKLGVLELAASNYLEVEKRDSLNIPLKFKLAEVYYKQKKYTDAVNAYLRILHVDSTNVQAIKNISKIFYLAKLYQNAAFYLTKYLNIEKSEDAYVEAANSFLEVGKYNEAYNYSKSGLQLYPNNNTLKKIQAITAYYLTKLDESVNLYTSLPDSLLNIMDLIKIGRAAEIINKDSLALQSFSKAYQKDSTLKEIFIDLANLNYLKKDYDKAIKFYKKQIEVDSNNEPAYRYIGFAYFQEQKYDESRKALLKAIRLNENQVSTHFWLAQVYKALDSLSKVEDEFQIVLKLIEGKESNYRNEGADAYGYLGQRAFERKNYSLASNYLKKALQLKADVLPFLIMLASSEHQLGNYSEAIKLYKRVLVLDPKNVIAKKGLRMLSAD